MERKINGAEDYEPIEVRLSPETTPIAYSNRVKDLICSGMDREDAERMALEPIELELYYEVEWGLFAVESGAADSCCFYSPYSKEEYL